MYCRIIAVLFGILVSGSAGATEEMKTSPMPDWVITSQFDLETPNVAESGDAGLDFILAGEQHNFSLRSPQSFFQYVTKVNSVGAIQQTHSVTIAYFPDYQVLRLHTLALWRDGERIDLVEGLAYQISRRETQGPSPESKNIEMAIFISDLRRGDLIDVAYSTEGQRSDFLGRFMGGILSAFNVPTRNIYRRIIVSKESDFRYGLMGGHKSPEIRENESTIEYIWDFKDVEANKIEMGAPVWHVQWPMVEFTDFADWNDVVRWGRQHFKKKNDPLSRLGKNQLS